MNNNNINFNEILTYMQQNYMRVWHSSNSTLFLKIEILGGFKVLDLKNQYNKDNAKIFDDNKIFFNTKFTDFADDFLKEINSILLSDKLLTQCIEKCDIKETRRKI